MNLKKYMFIIYAVFSIFLALIKAQSFNIESKEIHTQKLLLGNLKKDSDEQDNLVSTEKETPENISNSNKNTNESRISGNDNLGKAINVELTAYCNDKRCSDNWKSQTAMGTRTRVGVVAAPKNIPLGSKIYIPELKQYKEDGMFDVEDRGGAIKIKDDGTYVIDVWMPTHEEAVQFGRKTTTVYLAS